ncbi:hypothetical protein N9167_02325, partial [Akkermansiaceae bacterium]|nr:hypothetical protein [Akkermansiaceae bacterium]
IGIRGDEDREGYKGKRPPVFSQKPTIQAVYPFRDGEIGIDGVRDILEETGLGWPSYYDWRSRSGCYFCFYQQVGEWQNLKKHHPELFEKAKEYERKIGDKQFTWVQGKTLDQVVAGKQKEIQPVDETNGCAICHL